MVFTKVTPELGEDTRPSPDKEEVRQICDKDFEHPTEVYSKEKDLYAEIAEALRRMSPGETFDPKDPKFPGLVTCGTDTKFCSCGKSKLF